MQNLKIQNKCVHAQNNCPSFIIKIAQHKTFHKKFADGILCYMMMCEVSSFWCHRGLSTFMCNYAKIFEVFHILENC